MSYRKIITEKWAEIFKDYKVFKSLSLMKKVDCFAFGIYLDYSEGYDRSFYKPTFYLHNLCFRDSNPITLELNFSLKSQRNNVVELVPVDSDYQLIAERLINQNPIMKLNEGINDEVIELYKQKIQNHLIEVMSHPGILIESFFHVLNYYQYNEEFKQSIWTWCEHVIEMSEANAPDRFWYGKYGKFELFNRVRPLIENDYNEKVIKTLRKNVHSLRF